MSDVPPEVQALHLRLFEAYLKALIQHEAIRHDVTLCGRIERLLSLDEGGQPEKVSLTLERRDFEALIEMRTIASDLWAPSENNPDPRPEWMDKPSVADAVIQEQSSDVEQVWHPSNVTPTMTPEEERQWRRSMGHERDLDDQSINVAESAGLLQDVPSDEGRRDEGDAEAGVAGDVGVVLPIVQQPSSPRPASAGRKPYSYTESDLDNFWESRPQLTRESARRQLVQELRGGLRLASQDSVSA